MIKERDLFQKYKLRRLALELGEFTVNELRAIAGTDKETIETFIFNLKKEIPGAFTQEAVKTRRVGRPPTQYRLTPAAVRRLAAENAALGRQLSSATSSNEDSIRVLEPISVSESVVPGDNVTSWLSSLGASFVSALDEGGALTVKPCQAITIERDNTVTSLAGEIKFTREELSRVIKKILTPWQQLRLEQRGWIAGSYALQGHAPVCLQVETDAGEPTVKVRYLATHIPTAEELLLPALAEKLSLLKSGLILVTGIAGSGRTRAIGALVNGINTSLSKRIAIIEEPIRYFYPKSKSHVDQKQVAIDAPDFGQALDLVLRNDVDLVALSDVNDPHTFSTILEAAERKLFFCRVSASGPVEAIRKSVALFPTEDQHFVRSRLAENLAGIISVRGLPSKSGTSTVIAAEVLEWRRELAELIIDSVKTASIPEALANIGAWESFSHSVQRLYQAGFISQETLVRHKSVECYQKSLFPARPPAVVPIRWLAQPSLDQFPLTMNRYSLPELDRLGGRSAMLQN